MSWDLDLPEWNITMLPKFDGLWLQYAIAVGLAILGGIVRMLISNDTHTVLGVIRNMLIAAFGGLMAYLFATGQGLSDHVALFLCGMTGLAGVEGLRTLGKVYAASLRKDDEKNEVLEAVEDAREQDETDIFAGTKAAAKPNEQHN
jgi:hypothetical protein